MKIKTSLIPLVMIVLMGICIFAPIVSAETAEEWNEKGIDFRDSGEYEKAIECSDKAIELDPNYGDAYNTRGIVYDDLKQYERAIEDYNKAIELDPNGAYAYNNRGVTYNNLKKYKKAITDFDQAILLDLKYAGFITIVDLLMPD
ncbi:MAG: Photosystem I assembly protein Ycf3 [Candidatus Methanogaster sp.]|nr:MAG: Photosystem I assembly protein Ycf3 [ANME-2 cluster archaeon]